MFNMDREYTVSGLNKGYEYFIDYTHPLATGNSGRVYVHRHIASVLSNRWLTSTEVVHHIDENKQNNRPDNLVVLSTAEHSALHKGGALAPLPCITCKTLFIPTSRKQKMCSRVCFGTSQVLNTSITKEILDELIPKTSWVALGRLFGYSDNGIKKRAIALGCDIKALKNKCGQS